MIKNQENIAFKVKVSKGVRGKKVRKTLLGSE